jgi:iron complex outermembrane recepter protein
LHHRFGEIATTVSGVLRALSICVPVALPDVPPALAQVARPSVLTADIPEQPLAQALAAFGQQTGLHLVYVSTVVRDKRCRAVAAGLDVDAALARMLQGTGLRFEYLTPHSIRILAARSPSKTTTQTAADEPPEVIVTANRREESLQDVPITIQVLTSAKLARLNATTFDDFVSHVPGVTAHGVGPAQNNIYVRGLATNETGIQTSGGTGVFPNVAVYLDEQSAQLPHRNLDVYAADLDRIEILEGPQGTLFGAGAQAGVVRYITNKPKLDVTEVVMNAGYAATAHGAPSRSLEAVINSPIIPGRLGLRAVIYDEKRGGYIDNTPATFARAATDLGIHYAYANNQVPLNSVVINNFAIARRAINPVTYRGGRAAVLYQFADDWQALLTQSYQSIEAGGVFTEMAADSLGVPQPHLTVQLYNPSYNKDRFENTALTLEGRVGALKLLYAGAYLVRNVEEVHDYTSYARGPLVDYYECANPSYDTLTGHYNPAAAQCFTPSSTWRDVERNTHQSHELRLSTPDEWRIRGVGGLFHENYRIQEQTDWFYLTALPYFTAIGPPTGYFTLNGSRLLPNGQPVFFAIPGAVFVPAPVTSNNPHVRPPGDGYFNDITRGYNQKAAYASVDFELVPKVLTLTTGTRYFHNETSQVGSSVGSFGCELIYHVGTLRPPNPCVNHSDFDNYDSMGLHRTYSGFRSRVSLGWKVTGDALLYYTWSQGFRAGGFNRAGGAALTSALAAGGSSQATQHRGWSLPLEYAPDNLTNNEVGWKTRWWHDRLEWIGALYQEDWNHAQVTGLSTGAAGLGTPNGTINGGNYRVRGVETSGVASFGGFVIEANAAWNHSELVKEAPFAWADGTPIDFGALGLSNLAGKVGSPLAGAPAFQSDIRLRYEFRLDSYDAFVQVGALHQSHSLAATNRLALDLQGNSQAYDLPPFTVYDATFGVKKDGWLVQAHGENLTDTRAQLYANYHEWYKAVTVNRPRTISLRLSYRFSG